MDVLPQFDLLRPRTLDEVVKARADHPGSQLLGGGTDLVVNIRRGIVAPPTLIDVKRNGKTTPAVAVMTKMSLVFIFDRITGEPIFGMEERPVPQSGVPGEKTWPTQPFPGKPAPLPVGDAALVEWPRRRGRVLLFTSTVNMDWTSWPASPSFPAFIQEILPFAVAGPAELQSGHLGSR